MMKEKNSNKLEQIIFYIFYSFYLFSRPTAELAVISISFINHILLS
ncbi:hypothetical protein L950_0200255 [Sphingobacterium sp. IITKGP-BTPF85]|nr:hypothetical protein L950_0200255 [Sphingobacterium sp. IITKGP-BTPF85]